MTNNDGTAILLAEGTDYNSIATSGFYRCYKAVNRPTLGSTIDWTYLRVTKHPDSDNWVWQEVVDYRGNAAAYRVKTDAGWQSWQYYAVQNKVAEFTAVNQTKVYKTTIPGPYGLTASATRCGNIVNLSFDVVYKNAHQVSGTASETIPVGWRPTTKQVLTLTGHAGSGEGTKNWPANFVDLDYNSDGSIKYTIITETQPLSFRGSITWITTDPFPS